MGGMRELLLREVGQNKPHFCASQAREGRTAKRWPSEEARPGLGRHPRAGEGTLDF